MSNESAASSQTSLSWSYTISEVKLCFVLPTQEAEVTNDDTECKKEFEEAFEFCVKSGYTCTWLKTPKASGYIPAKTDIIIFYDFEGSEYKYLADKTPGIYGYRCILSCILHSVTVPEFPYHVFCNTMRNLVITCTGFVKEERVLIQNLVQKMSGIFVKDLNDSVTHLVAKLVGSPKYKVASEHKLPIMSPIWVEAVWHKGKTTDCHATDVEFDEFKCLLFFGLTISVSGLEKHTKENLTYLIMDNGGLYSTQLVMDETDLLVSADCKGTKYEYAKKWKIPCVTVDYIEKCVETGFLLKYEDFSVDKVSGTPLANSTATKENFQRETFNASTVSNIYRDSVLTVDETSFSHTTVASECSMIDQGKDTTLPNVSVSSKTITDDCDVSLYNRTTVSKPIRKGTSTAHGASSHVAKLYEGYPWADTAPEEVGNYKLPDAPVCTVHSYETTVNLCSTFYLFQEKPADVVKISNTLHDLGGKITSSFKNANFVVSGCIVDEEYAYRYIQQMNFVTMFWVEECGIAQEFINIKYYHRPLPFCGKKIMTGYTITCSTYVDSERHYIAKLIEYMGATYQEFFARVPNKKQNGKVSTHLICPAPTGTKYEAAVRWGIPAVNCGWLLACILNSKVVSMKPYMVLSPEDENALGNFLKSSTSSVCEQANGRRRNDSTIKEFHFKKPYADCPKETSQPTDLRSTLPGYADQSAVPSKLQPSIKEFQKLWGKVDTPNTPYGASLQSNPSSDLRKASKRWMNFGPSCSNTEVSSTKKKTKTPFSLLKKKLWDQEFAKQKEYGSSPKLPSHYNRFMSNTLKSPLEVKKQTLRGINAYIISDSVSSVISLRQNIESLGGSVSKTLGLDITHVIFQGTEDNKNEQYQAAKELGLVIVNPLWVNACMINGTRPAEALYPHTYSCGNLATPQNSNRTRNIASKQTNEDAHGNGCQSTDGNFVERTLIALQKRSTESPIVGRKLNFSRPDVMLDNDSDVSTNCSFPADSPPDDIDGTSFHISWGKKRASFDITESEPRSLQPKASETSQSLLVPECTNEIERMVLQQPSDSLVLKQPTPTSEIERMVLQQPSDSLVLKQPTPTSEVEQMGLQQSSDSLVLRQPTRTSEVEQMGLQQPSDSLVLRQPTRTSEIESWELQLSDSSEYEDEIEPQNLQPLNLVVSEGTTERADECDSEDQKRPLSMGLELSPINEIDEIETQQLQLEESEPMVMGPERTDQDEVYQVCTLTPQRVIMVSGYSEEETANLKMLIEKIGAVMSSVTQFDINATHLVVKKIQRNEKLLCSIASGKWIVHDNFLQDCMKPDFILQEQLYEFGNSSSKNLTTCNISKGEELANAAHYWRKHIKMYKGKGPFHKINAYIHTTVERQNSLGNLLQSGGGTITTLGDPTLTHCFIEHGRNIPKLDIRDLVKRSVLCLKPLYLNALLVQMSVADPSEFFDPDYDA